MPLAAIISLTEAKSWLRVTASTYDTELTAAIAAASGMVIARLGYDPTRGVDTEICIGKRSAYLFPTRKKIVGVTSCIDQETNDSVPCTYDAQAIRRTDGAFFVSDRAYSVTYTAGYAAGSDEMAAIALATRIAVQAVWGAAALDPNLTGDSMPGVFSGGYAAQGPGALPAAAQTILEAYRRRY